MYYNRKNSRKISPPEYNWDSGGDIFRFIISADISRRGRISDDLLYMGNLCMFVCNNIFYMSSFAD